MGLSLVPTAATLSGPLGDSALLARPPLDHWNLSSARRWVGSRAGLAAACGWPLRARSLRSWPFDLASKPEPFFPLHPPSHRPTGKGLKHLASPLRAIPSQLGNLSFTPLYRLPWSSQSPFSGRRPRLLLLSPFRASPGQTIAISARESTTPGVARPWLAVNNPKHLVLRHASTGSIRLLLVGAVTTTVADSQRLSPPAP